MEKKKILFRAMLLLSLLLIGFTIAVRNIKESINIDPTSFRILPVNTYYSEAFKIASEWESDAYLTRILATFTMPDENDALLIEYSFRSRLKPNRWLSVAYTTVTAQANVSEGEFSEENQRPLTQEIDIATLPFDTLDAIIIAYNNGGSDFIQKHRGISQDSFVELQQENEGLGTGNLVWVVTLAADRFTTMYITLDSTSGEVIELWRNDNK